MHTLCGQNPCLLNAPHPEVLVKIMYSEGARDVLLEENPYKTALLKQDTAPCLTSSFLQEWM